MLLVAGLLDPLVAQVAAWVVVALIAALGAIIVFYMLTGKIDLTRLISEPNGDASTSRLQLLIFTFVIATSLFLIVAANGNFPATIPSGVLVLLGISGSSYLVSKGIQFSNDAGVEDRPAAVVISPSKANAKVGGPPIPFSAEVIRQTDQGVTWTVSPAIGTVDATGKYTPPATDPADVKLPTNILITATSSSDASLYDTAGVTVHKAVE